MSHGCEARGFLSSFSYKVAFRQAPLSRPRARKRPGPPDPKAVAEVAESLADIEDVALKTALARLGAAIKRN